jgi:DNA-binding response OmpR family regulator
VIRKGLLVAGDLALVLSTMAVLSRESFDIVDMVSDGRAALEATLNFKRDLMVLDISIAVMSGIEVAEELTTEGNKAKVVILVVQAAAFRILTSAPVPTL